MAKHDDRRPSAARRPARAAVVTVLLMLAVVTAIALRIPESSARSNAANTSTTVGSGAATEETIAEASAEAAAASSSAASAAAASAAASAAAEAAAAQAAREAALTAIVAQDNSADADSVSIAALNVSTGASFQVGAAGGMGHRQHRQAVRPRDAPGAAAGQRGAVGRRAGDRREDDREQRQQRRRDAVRGHRRTGCADRGQLDARPGQHDPGSDRLLGPDRDERGRLHHSAAQPDHADRRTAERRVAGLRARPHAQRRERPALGVGVTADAGTDFANKNGWLAVDEDGDRWLVNSVGIVTIQGQPVLIAVLTQHNASFDAGVDLVQSLATQLAPLVLAR